MKDLFNTENGFKVLVIVLLSTIAFGTKAADFSGSVGASSDYVWRGVSQTGGDMSADLNLELSQGGFSAGVWTGTVDFSDDNDVETDWYVSYNREVMGVDVGVGYTKYVYSPIKDIVSFNDSSLDFEELYVYAGFDNFNVSHSMGRDDAPDYTEIGTSLLQVVDVSYGDYEGIGTNVTLSRELGMGFTASYIMFEAESDSFEDDNNLVVSYSYSF